MASSVPTIIGAAISGGGMVGVLVRILIQNYLKQNADAHATTNRELTANKRALELQTLALVRMEEALKPLMKLMDDFNEQGKDIAVIKETIKNLKDNVNGIGKKLRGEK